MQRLRFGSHKRNPGLHAFHRAEERPPRYRRFVPSDDGLPLCHLTLRFVVTKMVTSSNELLVSVNYLISARTSRHAGTELRGINLWLEKLIRDAHRGSYSLFPDRAIKGLLEEVLRDLNAVADGGNRSSRTTERKGEVFSSDQGEAVKRRWRCTPQLRRSPRLAIKLERIL